MCPRTTLCVRILLFNVSSYLCVSSYYQLVLIVPHSCLVILHMPPHTTTCPHTTHATTGVLILLILLCMCPHATHTTTYVPSYSSHYYICLLIQLILVRAAGCLSDALRQVLARRELPPHHLQERLARYSTSLRYHC